VPGHDNEESMDRDTVMSISDESDIVNEDLCDISPNSILRPTIYHTTAVHYYYYGSRMYSPNESLPQTKG